MRTTGTLNVGFVPVRAAGLTPSVSNTLFTNMVAYLRAVFPAAEIKIIKITGKTLIKKAGIFYHLASDDHGRSTNPVNFPGEIIGIF